MMRVLALVLFIAADLYAQTSSVSRRIVAGPTLPAACSLGQVYVKSGTGAGLYTCPVPPGPWVLDRGGNFVGRGTYAAGTTYAALDAVVQDSVMWVSLSAGNIGHTPAAGSTYWATIGPVGPAGSAGSAGAAGATGATGSQGAAGATGPQGVKGDTGSTGSVGPAGAGSLPAGCTDNGAFGIICDGDMTAAGFKSPAGTVWEHTGACQAASGITSPASGDFVYFCDSDNSNRFSRKDSAGVVKDIEPSSRIIGASFTGGGSALTSGTTPGVSLVYLPPLAVGCTATAWTATVDTGTAGFRVWRLAAGTAIPTVSNTLNTGDLAISTGTSLRSTSFANFTGSVAPVFAANDIVAIQLNAAATATTATFGIQCRQ